MAAEKTVHSIRDSVRTAKMLPGRLEVERVFGDIIVDRLVAHHLPLKVTAGEGPFSGFIEVHYILRKHDNGRDDYVGDGDWTEVYLPQDRSHLPRELRMDVPISIRTEKGRLVNRFTVTLREEENQPAGHTHHPKHH